MVGSGPHVPANCRGSIPFAIIMVSHRRLAPCRGLGGRPTVGRMPLEHVIGVRIPASQPAFARLRRASARLPEAAQPRRRTPLPVIRTLCAPGCDHFCEPPALADRRISSHRRRRPEKRQHLRMASKLVTSNVDNRLEWHNHRSSGGHTVNDRPGMSSS